jgi:glycosyltransferase involved in cell wall biosynthesis
MKISGVTFCKNAAKLFYPVKESILSVLPICDEFIVVLGDCDADDNTLELINSLKSDKIKVIHTVWDKALFDGGKIYSQQTNVGLDAATGDWIFYIQSDEVIHEKYLETIKSRCEELNDNKNVDGLLFRFKHFYGDYDHFMNNHCWYKKEIRIIRNNKQIRSRGDAQSFRFSDNTKLKVADVDAEMFHYGWVRPPRLMKTKAEQASVYYHFKRLKMSNTQVSNQTKFDYGNLKLLPIFTESHPNVMDDFIKDFSWKDDLNYGDKPTSKKLKHRRPKYYVLTFIEGLLFNHKRTLFGYQNWIKL